MFYYKKNIGDYYKKTGRLSMLEHGAYTLLIDSCYDRERFPTLDEAIEWAWARTDAEIDAVKFVLSRFFTLEDGIYTQKRISDELAKYRKNCDINQAIALEREEKRRLNKRSENESSTNRGSSVNEAPPNQEPRTKNQEPRTKNKTSDNDDLIVQVFEYWQKVFNKGRTKLDAKRKSKIKARLADGRTLTEIQTAIDNCSKSEFHVSNGHIDIELICRDDSKIESFLSRTNQQNRTPFNQPQNGFIDFSTIGNNQTDAFEHEVSNEPASDYPF